MISHQVLIKLSTKNYNSNLIPYVLYWQEKIIIGTVIMWFLDQARATAQEIWPPLQCPSCYTPNISLSDHSIRDYRKLNGLSMQVSLCIQWRIVLQHQGRMLASLCSVLCCRSVLQVYIRHLCSHMFSCLFLILLYRYDASRLSNINQ